MTGKHHLDNAAKLHDAIADCIHSVSLEQKTKQWCVALSGGPDSTALLHGLAKQAPQYDACLTALIVNHNLRPESSDEAEAVARHCENHGIRAVILTVTSQAPKTAIQEWARGHRYGLLCSYAREHDAVLWLAHHQGDQAETTAMRLAHDSGLRGLSGMTAKSQRQDVVMLRPFLHLSKQTLVTYCQDINVPFINDPSNQRQKFERVRWRNLLSGQPVLAEQLGTLQNFASRMRDVMDQTILQFVSEAAHWDNDYLSLHLRREAVSCLSQSAQIYLLRQLIGALGQPQYRPSFDSVRRLCKAPPANGQVTLGRTIIKFHPSVIDILPEAGRPHTPMSLKAGDNIVYQGRFIVSSTHACQLVPMTQTRLSALSEDNPYRQALMAYAPEVRMIFPYPVGLDERPVTTHIKSYKLECDMTSSHAAEPLVLIKPIYDDIVRISKDKESHVRASRPDVGHS